MKTASDHTAAAPIAVIGLGCLFPKADNVGAYWANIKNGLDAITEVPPSHWRPEDYFDQDPKTADKVYAKCGGFLSPVDFQPMEYGVLPNALEAVDTSQLLGMVAVGQALADAGYGSERDYDRDRVSVILGVTGTLELVIPLGARLGHPLWKSALKEAGVPDDVAADAMARIAEGYVPWQENSFPGLLGNVVAGRISRHFNFGGTNCVVDAACGSSLSALNLAALELASGKSDMVITGGVDTFNDIFMYTCFSKTPALSPSGHARPFDADGDGTTLGEGLGIVVLKRLADAERDGDKIYAVIKGIGTSSDGRGAAIYEPSANGQQKALRRAYEAAGVEPATIGLIEAHGTGTKVGDAVEVKALRAVYGEAAEPFCALGSVKSQIGHTKAAAGSAGLIKAVLALHHKVLPATIKVKRPNEAVTSGATPFYVNSETRPWLQNGTAPRRAAVSALGFGGSNFHCVLEEYGSDKPVGEWQGDVQLVLFSAADRAALRTAVQAFPATGSWTHIRSAAQASRAAFDPRLPCRLALVIEAEKNHLSALFKSALSLLEKDGNGSWSTPDGVCFACGVTPQPLAVLFPGQGAQYPQMLKDLTLAFPEVFRIVQGAEAVSLSRRGRSLAALIYPRPVFTPEEKNAQEAELRATDNAQPALGAVSLGAWELFKTFGVTAQAFAGHSYGELVALCAAGVYDASTLQRLSQLRGELMAAGSGDRGSMLAVSAPLAEVEKALVEEGLDLVLANKNTPEQGVLSGRSDEIARAAEKLKARGLRVTPLSVSAAFHSPLVAGAAEPFAAELGEIAWQAAQVPVFANRSAAPYPDDTATAKDVLARQLASPVEFVAEIQAMYASGIRTFVEVGPGARLTGMVKAILDGQPHQVLALDSSNGKRNGSVDLARVLAQLAVLGHELALTRWDEGFVPPAPPKKGLTVQLTGANYFQRPPKRPPVERKEQQVSIGPVSPMGPREKQTPVPAAPFAPSAALTDALKLTQQSMQALQSLQEQTAKLHQQFLLNQETTARSFLALMEQQRTLLGGQPLAPLPSFTAPVAPVVTPPAASPPTAVPAPVATPVPAVKAVAVDSGRAAAALLAVVSEKTGYPLEMLDLEMALDADLGIDSIKRVEILSALQERLPDAPAVKPEELGTLQTLGQIVSYLQAGMGATQATTSVPPAVDSGGDSAEVAAVLLAVVADKTGYPQEMLELGMALDADLGIDSIKRVEILSALQERLPGLPAVKPEELGVLQTLGQIVTHLSSGIHRAAPASSTPSVVHGGLERAAVAAALLGVIADKTGYPQEMLELEMALDADLGIDSIKRVEILSALQERLPGAPAVKPEHLGTLQTVGQIVDFLASVSGAPSAPVLSVAVAASDDVPAATVERQLLKVVPLPPRGDRDPFALPAGSPIWVSDDGGELASALTAALTARGFAPRVIAASALPAAPGTLAGLILLPPTGGSNAASLLNSFRLLQLAGPALRAAAASGPTLCASVSRLNGRFGLLPGAAPLDPLSGGLAGLTKTAGHEWPQVRCRALDLASDFADSASAAQAIVDELLSDGPVEVGLSATGLHTLKLSEQPLPEREFKLPLASGEVVVISGGARGVTAEAAVSLARASRATLLLLGRSPAPEPEPAWLAGLSAEGEIKGALIAHSATPLKPREVEERYRALLANREVSLNLQRIADAGGRPLYRSVDLRDPAAVAAVIAEARSQGPIRGLIHGAGVLADRLIADKTAEQFEQVFATKVAGLESLLAATEQDELAFIALFSSSTGRFGRTGQVDYAVANEVLNKTAQQLARLRPACRVVSLNWGPWDGGMVTPALKKLFASEGVEVIDLTAGADYLVRELATPPGGPVELVILGSRAEVVAKADAPQNLHLTKAFDLELSVAACPFLASHVIGGKAVLPVAMIVEWLAHAAIHNHPGLRFHGFNDLRVLKGVTLDAEQNCQLAVLTGKAIKSDGFHVVPVELTGVDAQGRSFVHSRARIVLAAALPVAKGASAPLQLAPYSRPSEQIYQTDRLFHGPALHGISRVAGYSQDGISALVKPAPQPQAWLNQPLRNNWLADPLALDSAFQMMILWSFERFGAANLPVFAGRYRQFRDNFPAGSEIRIRVVKQSASKATAEIEFLDPVSGEVVARLDDYECVIDASLNASFQRNTLAGVARG